MSVNKIKILCRGFRWDEGTDINEINFFSAEPRTPVTDEVDLMDFAVELGELEYNFDDVDDEKGYGSLFFTSGNITVKVTDGEIHGLKMSEFFKIYEDTQYIKYRVRLLYNDELLFQGTVHQDGLKEKFSQDNESQTIEVLIVGFEKEMKDYFNTKPLIDPENVPWLWNSYYVGGGARPGAYSEYIKHRQFPLVVEGLFDNNFINSFDYDNDINEWFVAKEGRFVISPHTDNRLHHTKQGYERFWQDRCTRWKWLEWICNSMGWVYFIWKDTFYMRNRSGFSLPVTEIDYNSIIEYEIGKRKPSLTYDYIMFLAGAYYGGDGAMIGRGEFRGERPVILCNKQTFYRNTNHFNQANGVIGIGYAIDNSVGYKFSKYESEDNSIFSMYNIEHVRSGSNGYDIYSIPIEQEKILKIDVGGSGKSWSRMRLDEGQDYPYDNGVGNLTNWDLTYTGGSGDCLMKILENAKQSLNYSGRYGADGYVNSQQFANNYAKFWDNKTNHFMTVELAQLITNPMQNFRIINSGHEFFDSSDWGIQSVKLNLIEGSTELELLKIN